MSQKMELPKRVSNKKDEKFYCKKCDYGTSRKENYTRHLFSNKHKKKPQKSNSKPIPKRVKARSFRKHICVFCKKEYKTQSGLWKHNNKCTFDTPITQKNNSNHYIEEENDNDDDEYMMVHKPTLKMCMEKLAKGGGNTTMGDHNTVNSNNTQNISINLFLNEHCKDALNLEDFMNKIQYKLQDVLNQQQAGYTKGIANVMVKNLKDLPVTERPIHCSDQKRGVFHVKDKEEGWVKEKGLEPGSKTMKACEKMNFKSVNGINTWQDENPNWQNDGNLLGERDKIAPKMYGPSDKYKANVAALKMVGEEVNIKDAIAEVSKNS